MGHVDYYPNGGHDQPGCDIGLTDITSIENAKKYVVCNHERYVYGVNLIPHNKNVPSREPISSPLPWPLIST